MDCSRKQASDRGHPSLRPVSHQPHLLPEARTHHTAAYHDRGHLVKCARALYTDSGPTSFVPAQRISARISGESRSRHTPPFPELHTTVSGATHHSFHCNLTSPLHPLQSTLAAITTETVVCTAGWFSAPSVSDLNERRTECPVLGETKSCGNSGVLPLAWSASDTRCGPVRTG